MKKYGLINKPTLKWRNKERNSDIYRDYIGYLEAGNPIGDIYVELARAYTLSYRTIQNIVTAERKAAGRTATEDMAIAQRAAERR